MFRPALVLCRLALAGACAPAATREAARPGAAAVPRELTAGGSHLLVPVANNPDPAARTRLEVRAGDRLVQAFDVALPAAGEPSWTAAYPLGPLGAAGEPLTLRPAGGSLPGDRLAGFDRARTGPAADALDPADWGRPYRNRFHLAARRGWNNDPNGLVHHGGRWHVFYQWNPFGIFWGNMHWGHFASPDLVTWTEYPTALFQRTPEDAAFSGGGFVDSENTAGLGAGTLFVAFTSTGRGECLAYSTDGGVTFEELPGNPVVRHEGRDPKIFRHEPTGRWVMAVYEEGESAATRATPSDGTFDKPTAQIAFYASENLRDWTRTGAFTHPDRRSVYECPELFELPLLDEAGGATGGSRWVLYAAPARYFVGDFDGETFAAESGPHGRGHGAFYAAQNVSDAPGGRAVRVGWVRTPAYLDRFPAQLVNQCLSLPHRLTLRATADGPRLRYAPAAELTDLRAETLLDATDLTAAEAAAELAAVAGGPLEVEIGFAGGGRHAVTIGGTDAGFAGVAARVFVDRTVTEIFSENGGSYRVTTRDPARFEDATCEIGGGEPVARLRAYRLRSFWPPAGVAAGSAAEDAGGGD